MPNLQEIALFKDKLWTPSGARPANIYGIFDCARTPEIYDAVTRSYRDKCCLFAGALDPELERAAPHLLWLSARDSVTDYLLSHAWSDPWGVLLQTESSFAQVRRHLRTLLRVRDEAGRFMLFRYYDPRVLGVYLESCHPAELRLVFGSAISRFLVPSMRSGGWWSYSLEREELRVTRVDGQQGHA